MDEVVVDMKVLQEEVMEVVEVVEVMEEVVVHALVDGDLNVVIRIPLVVFNTLINILLHLIIELIPDSVEAILWINPNTINGIPLTQLRLF